MSHSRSLLVVGVLLALFGRIARADDFHPVFDPFGDPKHPTEAPPPVETEKKAPEHQEHQEHPDKPERPVSQKPRHILLGLDLGTASFTGGLGQTVSSGFLIGTHVDYFLSHTLAGELGFHYSHHTDGVHGADIATSLLPITVGARYSPFLNGTSRTLLFLNPYIAGGVGIYLRNQNVLRSGGIGFKTNQSTTNNFGLNAALGTEINLYHGRYFAGAEFRYHMVFFNDADSTLGGAVAQGSRAGNYVTFSGTLALNF